MPSEKSTTQQRLVPPTQSFGTRYEQGVPVYPSLSGSYTQQQTARPSSTFGTRFEQGVPVDRGMFHSYSDGGQLPQQ